MPLRPSDVLNDDPDMRGAARRILANAGAQVGGTARSKYMRSGGTGDIGPNTQTGPGSLRRQTSRLERSLSDKPFDRNAPEGVFDLTPTQDGAKLTYGSEVPYAATHEYGDRRSVTSKQRRFFWAKYSETDKDKWKAMALSETLDYPKRPYLEPALDDTMDDVKEMAEEEVFKVLFDED